MPEAETDRQVPPPRTSVDGNKAVGIYDDFRAYRTPTDADYRELFTNGLIIPDTNVLLSLYRYNEQTRDDLLAVLRRLSDLLWVPHQVMHEFWRNREAVLKDPQDRDDCISRLSTHRNQATQVFSKWASRVHLSLEQSDFLRAVIAKAFSDVVAEIKEPTGENSLKLTHDTNTDRVLAALEPLLEGRVGTPLSSKDYENALKEAKIRAEQKRPPGYKDSSKDDGGASGDYLIWIQVLREAAARGRDVLLITGDVKDDWWRREHGELRGPRPELVQEIKAQAGVRLYMLRPDSLLYQARQALQIDIRNDSVEDAERVSQGIVGTDIDEQSWDDIIKAVEKRSKTAARFLRSASVDSLDDDALTVFFRRSYDAKDFIDSKSPAVLSQALEEVLGIERGVTVLASEDHHLAHFTPQSWARSDPETAATSELPEENDGPAR